MTDNQKLSFPGGGLAGKTRLSALQNTARLIWKRNCGSVREYELDLVSFFPLTQAISLAVLRPRGMTSNALKKALLVASLILQEVGKNSGRDEEHLLHWTRVAKDIQHPIWPLFKTH